LAERSAASAKQIKELINESSGQVSNGVKLSQEAGKNLQIMLIAIATVADQLNAVAATTSQQASTMEENTSITEGNASAAEELAASSEEMSTQAQELLKLVSQFKVNNSA